MSNLLFGTGDWYTTPIDLNKKLIMNPPATFFMKINGEKFAKFGFTNNSIIIVDKSLKAFNGAMCVAQEYGEFALRKCFIKNGKMIFCDEKNEESKCEDIQLWGVITYSINSYAKKC